MERGQHDLRGSGEPQLVGRDFVGLLAVPGELALVQERLLARDRRDGDGRKAGGGDPLQRPGHQLRLEQRQPALEAIGAAARHLGDARQIGPVVLLDQRDMVERLEGEVRRIADGPDDGVEALVGPDRRAVVGDARKPQHQRRQLRLLHRKVVLDRRSPRSGILRLAAQLRLLFRRRFRELRADRVALGPQRFDLGLERAHLRIEREQRVEVELDPLVADRALDRLAVGLDEVHAQHAALASGTVSSLRPRPLSGGSKPDSVNASSLALLAMTAKRALCPPASSPCSTMSRPSPSSPRHRSTTSASPPGRRRRRRPGSWSTTPRSRPATSSASRPSASFRSSARSPSVRCATSCWCCSRPRSCSPPSRRS